MLTITICVGSSCYVRGSDRVAEALTRLIEKEKLAEIVELTGAFCMEHCSMGVSVRLEETVHEVLPDEAAGFFYTEVVPRVRAGGVA